MIRLRQTHLVLTIAGGVIGAVAMLLLQSGPIEAQSERSIGMYQFAPTGAAAMIWRINTTTGGLELCYVTNRAEWIDGKTTTLAARCAIMPPPSI